MANRVSVEEAHSGDIVVIAGIADISIGETLCEKDHVMPLEKHIHVENQYKYELYCRKSSILRG